MSDDFSDTVKKALAARVGHLCSNPECRALTSGPQDDPAKAVNIGVAAHITAASPGGPRYDPDLLAEERSAPSNGIWLCQNCAKLIDNDPTRFTVEVLKKWKTDAEEEAKTRVGKTAPINESPVDLTIGSRFKITPIVPREHEQSDFLLLQIVGDCFQFEKLGTSRQVNIPKSFIEKVHKFGDTRPALIQLSARLQWVTPKRNFDLFPEKPPGGSAGACGVGKNIDFNYPARAGINGSFAREDQLPRVLSEGWSIFYDSDGRYFRWPGHEVDQILVYRERQ